MCIRDRYDSLYGTDIIQSEESASERYDPERAQEVIKYTKKFLDKHFTLTKDSWSNVNKIEVNKNQLIVSSYKYKNKLKNKKKFVGYRGDKDKPRAIIL